MRILGCKKKEEEEEEEDVQIDAKTNGSVPILTDVILLRSGACLVGIRPHSHSTKGLSMISETFSGLASSASQLLKFEE